MSYESFGCLSVSEAINAGSWTAEVWYLDVFPPPWQTSGYVHDFYKTPSSILVNLINLRPKLIMPNHVPQKVTIGKHWQKTFWKNVKKYLMLIPDITDNNHNHYLTGLSPESTQGNARRPGHSGATADSWWWCMFILLYIYVCRKGDFEMSQYGEDSCFDMCWCGSIDLGDFMMAA